MEEELIDHISKQLSAHEEPYSEGAWERFSTKKEEKKRVIYWPIWSAVAVLLISFGLYFGLKDDKADFDKITKQSTGSKQTKETLSKPNLNVQDNLTENPVVVLTEKTEPVRKSINNTPIPPTLPIESKQPENLVQNNFKDKIIANTTLVNPAEDIKKTIKTEPVEQIASTVAPTIKTETVPWPEKKPVTKISFEELLAKDSALDKQKSIAKNSKSNKWQPDLYVAPAMGNDSKVNINYGFSISYAVADQLSIGSGIAYNTLSSASVPAENNNLSPNMPSSFGTNPSPNSKSLESVQAQLRGITIPLDLKYNLSSKVYASVGISALAILNNNVQNNYLSNSIENRQVLNSSGVSEQKTLFVKEMVSEPATESALSNDKYLGFYNFSIGYKQKISNKNNIAFEPFLSIPMKSFSKESINLTNGGFKLKVSF